MGTVSERVVPYLLFSIPLNLNEDKYLGKFDTRPNSVKNAEVFGSILGGMVGFSVGSGITQIGSNVVKNSYRSLTNTNASIMTKTESAIAKQGAIYLEEKNGVWEATNNATPSIFKNEPALLPKTSTATTIKEVYKKTATRKEEPHSTVVKTSTKKESIESPHSTGKISSKSSTTGETGSSKTKEVYKKTTTKKESTETTSTGKTSSKSSTTGKETSRIIITDSSKETETEIRNIGDFATIKIEKTNSEIPSAYMIDGMTKGGKEKTSGIGSGSYFESYRGGKNSGSKESGYRGNGEGYKFNGNSSNSSKNASSSTKNELDSKNDSWKFNSETPKTAVKNSEGNYTLGRNNEWNFDTKYNIPYTETGNKGQGLVSVPTYNAVTNDYSRNYDVFYRTISETHYNRLMETGDIPPKKETSITQNFSYSSGYQEKYGGVTIEIVTQPGTLRVLEKIGVKNNDGLEINKWYPNMEKTFTGWEKFGRVQFKEEKSQITINLGKGSGLEIFNQRIKQINVKQGDIHHGKNK